MPICTKCGSQKTRRASGYFYCNPCLSAKSLREYHSNKNGRRTDQLKRYRTLEYRLSQRRCYYKREYGITLIEYNTLEVAQNKLCAICKNPETLIKRKKLQRLSVDHSHKTGKIRALLCNSCNAGLAQFKENIDTMLAAIDYTNKHKDVEERNLDNILEEAA